MANASLVALSGFADNFPGNTHDDLIGRNGRAFRDHTSCRNQAALPDVNVIEDDGPDPDHAVVFHLGAMDDGTVADGHLIAQLTGESRIRVEDDAILNVGPCPNRYRLAIAPQDGLIPDTGLFTQGDSADHGG